MPTAKSDFFNYIFFFTFGCLRVLQENSQRMAYKPVPIPSLPSFRMALRYSFSTSFTSPVTERPITA